MATRLEPATMATVSIEIPLKANGDIAVDGDTAASQKAYSMNFFNGLGLLSVIMTNPESAHSQVEAFCSDIWGDIFQVHDYDTYSIKSKVEFVTGES